MCSSRNQNSHLKRHCILQRDGRNTRVDAHHTPGTVIWMSLHHTEQGQIDNCSKSSIITFAPVNLTLDRIELVSSYLIYPKKPVSNHNAILLGDVDVIF